MIKKTSSIVSAVLVFSLTTIPFDKVKAEDEGLFSDWGGVKSDLAKKNIDLNVVYKIESVSLVGGDRPKRSTSLGNLDVTADFKLDNWNIFLYGLGNHGGSPTDIVGDSFGTSNIQAPNTFKLYEAYIQNTGTNFSGLFGLRDLNADFYVTEASKPLLNSAFGVSPVLSQTGPNGPSIFPVTAPTISIKYQSQQFYFQAAIFNALAGNPNHPNGTHVHSTLEQGTLSILETGFLPQENKSSSKYSIGAWSYSDKIEQFDTSLTKKINHGFYFLFEHEFNKQLSTFFKAGTAEKRVNAFTFASELGLGMVGVLDARPDDILTFGIARGQTSKTFQNFYANDTDNETVYEVAYTIFVHQGVYLTPDFQYIVNPGLSKASEAAQVAAIRAEIHF